MEEYLKEALQVLRQIADMDGYDENGTYDEWSEAYSFHRCKSIVDSFFNKYPGFREAE